jgi:hypothetical protein
MCVPHQQQPLARVPQPAPVRPRHFDACTAFFILAARPGASALLPLAIDTRGAADDPSRWIVVPSRLLTAR